MFRIALTRYSRGSSRMMVAICSRNTILSSFRSCTSVNGNSRTSSKAPKWDERVENQAARRIAEPSRPEISDPLKSFDSIEEVFYHLGKYPKVDIHQYRHVLQTILDLYRTGRTKLSKEEIYRAEEFETLIEDVGNNVRFMNINHVLSILKVLLQLGISSDSGTCQALLRSIFRAMHNFRAGRILFAYILVRKFPRSPLVDKLQSALPVLFEKQVHSLLDTDDVRMLGHAVRFVFVCQSISVETRDLLVNAALENVDKFQLEYVGQILRCIKLAEDDPKNIHDLHTALMTRLCDNFDQLDSVGRIVALPRSIIVNYLNGDETLFNQELIEKAIESVTESDKFLALDTGNLLRQLEKISYYCPALLDHIDKQFQQSADLQRFPLVLLFAYVFSCANCSYKPQNWKTYEDKLVRILERSAHGRLFWEIATSLMVLKCWSKAIVEYCLRDDRWQPDSEEGNDLPYLAMMNMYQCVKLLYSDRYTGSYPSASSIKRVTNILLVNKEYPLLDSLKVGLGGLQYVLHGVNTKLGQIIDYLIVKCRNGELYPINTALSTDNIEILYESLSVPEDSFPIAIVLLDPTAYCLDGIRLRGSTKLQLQCLEVYGITPIPISHYQWLELSDYEKVAFLVYKIDACVPTSKSRRMLR